MSVVDAESLVSIVLLIIDAYAQVSSNSQVSLPTCSIMKNVLDEMLLFSNATSIVVTYRSPPLGLNNLVADCLERYMLSKCLSFPHARQVFSLAKQ